MMFNDIRLHCGRGGLELRDRPVSCSMDHLERYWFLYGFYIIINPASISLLSTYPARECCKAVSYLY